VHVLPVIVKSPAAKFADSPGIAAIETETELTAAFASALNCTAGPVVPGAWSQKVKAGPKAQPCCVFDGDRSITTGVPVEEAETRGKPLLDASAKTARIATVTAPIASRGVSNRRT